MSKSQNQNQSTSTSTSTAKHSATAIIFTLAVHDNGQANALAYRFAVAALDSGQKIDQVFFYHDAIHTADARQQPNAEDLATPGDWSVLAQSGGFALNVCVAAAQRRGLMENTAGVPNAAPLKPGFELVGLGQYIAGMIDADRVVTFSNQ